MKGFAPIRDVDGGNVSLNDLGPREIYLNDRAARDLRAESGDRVMMFVGETRRGSRARGRPLRWRRHSDAALLVPLDRAQTLLAKAASSRARFEPRRGETTA